MKNQSFTEYMETINDAQHRQIIDLFETIEDLRKICDNLETEARAATADLAQMRGAAGEDIISFDQCNEVIRIMGGARFTGKIGKIDSIKLVRVLTGAGLKEAKDMVEGWS